MTGDDPGKGKAVLSLLLRLVLGAVFLYAGIGKALDPAGFSQAIANYVILPDRLVAPVAIVLPWVEIAAGLSLVSGMLLPGGAIMVAVLMIVFSCALGFALARGLDISCGCFSAGPGGDAITWWYLLRDLALLVMAGTVLHLSPSDRYTAAFLIRGIREKDGPETLRPS